MEFLLQELFGGFFLDNNDGDASKMLMKLLKILSYRKIKTFSQITKEMKISKEILLEMLSHLEHLGYIESVQIPFQQNSSNCIQCSTQSKYCKGCALAGIKKSSLYTSIWIKKT